MDVLERFEELVDDVFLVYGLEDVNSYDLVQVSFHEIKNHVEVLVIFGLDDVLESNDVLMLGELFEEDDFAEGSLSVSGVVEGIKDFFERNDLPGS